VGRKEETTHPRGTERAVFKELQYEQSGENNDRGTKGGKKKQYKEVKMAWSKSEHRVGGKKTRKKRKRTQKNGICVARRKNADG